ncbi:uncharacterized protein LOC127597536 isoform X3 [Hippocampus zosterae]|uniref:uncharacterized protein LOC127597536 isoform X3 n=1 Tax=Hippocampus zosterae TaxID=109293 RepID=UPI00223DFC03|nr:uncharacterized protein LOC127597536 isoform X3 [Hippocampus zosterae]
MEPRPGCEEEPALTRAREPAPTAAPEGRGERSSRTEKDGGESPGGDGARDDFERPRVRGGEGARTPKKTVRFREASADEPLAERAGEETSLFPDCAPQEWSGVSFDELFQKEDWQRLTDERLLCKKVLEPAAPGAPRPVWGQQATVKMQAVLEDRTVVEKDRKLLFTIGEGDVSRRARRPRRSSSALPAAAAGRQRQSGPAESAAVRPHPRRQPQAGARQLPFPAGGVRRGRASLPDGPGCAHHLRRGCRRGGRARGAPLPGQVSEQPRRGAAQTGAAPGGAARQPRGACHRARQRQGPLQGGKDPVGRRRLRGGRAAAEESLEAGARRQGHPRRAFQAGEEAVGRRGRTPWQSEGRRDVGRRRRAFFPSLQSNMAHLVEADGGSSAGGAGRLAGIAHPPCKELNN